MESFAYKEVQSGRRIEVVGDGYPEVSVEVAVDGKMIDIVAAGFYAGIASAAIDVSGQLCVNEMTSGIEMASAD